MKQIMTRLAALLAVATIALYAQGALADVIGSVRGVSQGATQTYEGTTTVLSFGDKIEEGAVIRTDGSGTVQLEFIDLTLVAVGPNSEFEVTAYVMRNDRLAKDITFTAVTGAFRFFSGRSAKSAYTINTPTATMGIRGTRFDVDVRKPQVTDLAVLDGEVNFCSGGACKPVPRGCNLARAGGGNVTLIDAPEEGKALLGSGFPFITGQGGLNRNLQTDLADCERYAPKGVSFLSSAPTQPAAEPRTGPKDRDAKDEPDTDGDEPEDPEEPEQPTGGCSGDSDRGHGNDCGGTDTDNPGVGN